MNIVTLLVWSRPTRHLISAPQGCQRTACCAILLASIVKYLARRSQCLAPRESSVRPLRATEGYERVIRVLGLKDRHLSMLESRGWKNQAQQMKE